MFLINGHAMKYGESGGIAPPFLTSAVDGVKYTAIEKRLKKYIFHYNKDSLSKQTIELH
jgi:hypothetical protein